MRAWVPSLFAIIAGATMMIIGRNYSSTTFFRLITRGALIIHPLTLKGYRSIGCAPLTFPVGKGEDARSGRFLETARQNAGCTNDTEKHTFASLKGLRK